MATTRLRVEGWRGINHSYAMVNQYQSRELLRRPGLALFHTDLPFHGAHWNPVANASGFAAVDAAAIAAIPPPDGSADIAYRIAYPYRAHGGPEAKTFCQITCEYRRIMDDAPYFPAPSGPDIDPRTQFITPSHWSRQGLIASGLGADRIHVVPHGVDPKIFYPSDPEERGATRLQLKIAPGRFVFLNVGAMTDNKGVDILLLAFAEVRRRHPHALLLLKDQRSLYGITGGSVIERARQNWPEAMAGMVPGSVAVLPSNLDLSMLRKLYGACDAYISPYRAEAFNMPPLEAAACGLPIAVTAGGATDDYIHDSFALPIASRSASREKLEFLEPELDSVLDAMLRLIERRTPQIDTPAALRHIGDHFTWKHAVDKLLAAFAA